MAHQQTDFTPPGAESGSQAGNLPRPLACALCQHRKVKCDRKSPCSNCVKVCIFSLRLHFSHISPIVRSSQGSYPARPTSPVFRAHPLPRERGAGLIRTSGSGLTVAKSFSSIIQIVMPPPGSPNNLGHRRSRHQQGLRVRNHLASPLLPTLLPASP